MAALLALILAACSGPSGQAAPSVAWVDGQPITLGEFNARAAFMGLGGDPGLLDKSLRREMIEDLVSRRLVLEDAARQGIDLDPQEALEREQAMLRELDEKAFEHNLAIHGISRHDWRAELERQMLMEKALRMILMPQARVDTQEVRDYYQRNRERFHRPEQILALHALLPSRELAQKLVNQVKAGQDMSAAAEAMGAPLAEGGRPAWLSRGHMPLALEKKVFALKPGQLAGPLPSTYGFHVVLVQAKRPAQRLSLAQAAPEIQQSLAARRREKLAVEYLERLRSKAQVKYDDDFLELGRLASPRSG
ncbi:MAG: peptidyl-prolyl cis-trans isomerase [Desulfarculaceae bacterium]|nr:peptidyl-prolyl cis-trans isomerase [Desulfarculaceae bacterium]MCF8071797.1 peptidyl-prolyl cis-trans isomerase [Desulfarculaceae bacterium]MCF8101347.1 peptidyl-prolyl cis-trans isomerase [Desulfarculaceae bacterium]